MATSETTNSSSQIPSDWYLLVSDSNEGDSQFDSKKLSQEDLANLAQDNLFKTHLTIMDRYLTKNQFENYKLLLQAEYQTLLDHYNQVKDKAKGLFRVVDGQVIFIECSKVPIGKTPQEYIREHWYIPSNYVLNQLTNCMVRGVTQKSVDDDIIVNPNGQTISLNQANMPSHMHQSSITNGIGIETMQGNHEIETGLPTKGAQYDMFYNDSFSTGLSNNEVEGVVDNLEVQNNGQTGGYVQHNNLPAYHKFYAFVVNKIGV